MLCWNLSSWFRAGTAESEWVGSLCLSMGECWNMKPEPSPRWTHQPWQTKVQRLKLLRKCLEEEAGCSNHQTLWCQPSVGHLHPHWQVEDSSRQFLATEKQDCHGISMEYFCCQGRISINVIDHPLIICQLLVTGDPGLFLSKALRDCIASYDSMKTRDQQLIFQPNVSHKTSEHQREKRTCETFATTSSL